MSIQIASTTDSDTEVMAAIGGQEGQSEVEQSSAPQTKKEGETNEDSETSESESPESANEAEGEDEGSQDEDSSEETEDEESSEDQRPEKKGQGFRKRLKRLQAQKSEEIRQKLEAQRDAEFWRQKALAREQGQNSEESNDQVSDNGKPKAEDFDTSEEHVQALVKWELSRLKEEEIKENNQNKARNEHQEKLSEFQSQTAKLASEIEDFEEVISDVDDIVLSVDLQAALLDSDLGPQVMYELCKDRKELVRVNGLTPMAAARAIGQLEARIHGSKKDASKPKPKKTTKAPSPISPVSGGGSAKVQKSIEDMSYREYKNFRES